MGKIHNIGLYELKKQLETLKPCIADIQ